LQQASSAIEGLGIFSLEEGVISRHLVHTTEGVLGNGESEKWTRCENSQKRTNVHIALYQSWYCYWNNCGQDAVQWGHQLVDFKNAREGVELSFQMENQECASCSWSRWYSQFSSRYNR
jgi:hypothetical protein